MYRLARLSVAVSDSVAYFGFCVGCWSVGLVCRFGAVRPHLDLSYHEDHISLLEGVSRMFVTETLFS
jgi:hypothetical protein